MERKVVVCVGAVVLAAALISGTAEATTARKAAVLGNFLVDDDTDVFLWPGVLPLYANGIFLDIETTGLDGNGGFIAEKGIVFGAFFHRPEPFLSGAGIPSDFQEIDALYTGIDLDEPFDLFHILLGFPIGDWHAFGLGISFAHSLNMDDVDGVDTGERELSTGIVLGFTSGLNGRIQNDLGLEMRFNYFEEIDADSQLYKSKPIPSFTLVDRLLIRKPGFFSWGFDFMFSRRDYSVDVGTYEGQASRYILGLMMGPRLSFADRILVAASLEILYDAYGGDMVPAVGLDEPMGWQHNFVTPGFNLATEITVLKWLFVRAAFDYTYLIGLYDITDHPDPMVPDTTSMTDNHRFLWSVGLGLRFKGIGVDAVISAPLFTDGPEFIGGRSPGLFSMVSFSYIF